MAPGHSGPPQDSGGERSGGEERGKEKRDGREGCTIMRTEGRRGLGGYI